MNIIESNSILLSHFLKNDSLTNEQFPSITPKKVSVNEAEAAFSYSLDEMEKKQIISKFIGVNNENKAIFTWILRQPIISIPQNVQISGNTALVISEVVNDFYSQVGEKDMFCNPLSITENDIQILMEIIELLAQNNLENKEEILEDKKTK